jgi:hypothetical protein
MSKPSSDDSAKNSPLGFNSVGDDIVDIFVKGHGDTTVRPCPPALLAQAQALQALIKEWEGKEIDDDIVDIFVEGRGDTTVRPCPPALLAHLQELQALTKEWEGKEIDFDDDETAN